MIPIRPPSGVPSPAAPTSTAPRRRGDGAPDRPPAVAGLRRGRRPRGARAEPRRPVRHGRRLPHGGAPPHPAGRGAGGAAVDRRRPGTGGLQGTRRRRPLPRARAATHGGHRPPAAAPRPPARAGGPGRGGLAGGARRRWRPLRHRPGPRRGALPLLELHYGLEGTSQRVTALDPRPLWARRQPIACAGHARLRAAARRRTGRAGGARREAAPRLRAAGLDRRPGHDRGRRGGARDPRRLGAACAPWPRMHGA